MLAALCSRGSGIAAWQAGLRVLGIREANLGVAGISSISSIGSIGTTNSSSDSFLNIVKTQQLWTGPGASVVDLLRSSGIKSSMPFCSGRSTPSTSQRQFSSAGPKEAAANDANGGPAAASQEANDNKQPDSSAEGPGSSSVDAPADATALAAQLQEKEAQAKQLTEQISTLTDSLKRAMAETENVRMRTAREMDNAKKFAVQGLVKAILDVADNLERAAASVPAGALVDGSSIAADPEQLRKLLKGMLEGVGATERILLQVLKQNGVEQYDPLGAKFDPNLHNALFEVPDPEKEAGTVAAVTKRGYKLHDRVIRPAEVGVARAP